MVLHEKMVVHTESSLFSLDYLQFTSNPRLNHPTHLNIIKLDGS